MTPDTPSLSDRLVPEWLTGDGEGHRPGGEGPFRGPLQRIVQLRDGVRAAVPALPDSRAETGARALEVAESAVSRARALVTAVEGGEDGESGGPGREGGTDGSGAGPREVGELLDRVRSALQELHYQAVRLKVLDDHPGAETGQDGAADLERALERAEGAADELETVARGLRAEDDGS